MQTERNIAVTTEFEMMLSLQQFSLSVYTNITLELTQTACVITHPAKSKSRSPRSSLSTSFSKPSEENNLRVCL